MESDDEIEYLDEDEEIVQQCIQSESGKTLPVALSETKTQTVQTPKTPLLVERPASKKIKRKIEEDDSDYDPREDLMPPISKKKKTTARNVLKSVKTIPSHVATKVRRKMDIGIPDYDDPLCLPVRAMVQNKNDARKLKSWNNACLMHLKDADRLMKPEKGVAKKSSRSLVLRNFLNKDTGKYETAVWSKTTVESREGKRKTHNFQSILPKFTERTVLTFPSVYRKPKKNHHVDEVILTKEETKKEESLVAYKPREHLSAIYKMIEKPSGEESKVDKKKYLREVSCAAACAACYQMSWRGLRQTDSRQTKDIKCPICERTFVSVYNLLAHVRSHSDDDVRRNKEKLTAVLAEEVGYHYKCRICQKQLPSIKFLRIHLREHKGKHTFACEVGNHTTT